LNRINYSISNYCKLTFIGHWWDSEWYVRE